MKVNLRSIIVIVSFIILFFNASAFAQNNSNILNKVSLTRLSDNKILLNIETKKKFSSKLILFEKSKNVYFVSLPETLYSGPKKLNVADFNDDVSDLTVEFMPSDINKDKGYTKISVYTKGNAVVQLKERVAAPKWLLALVFVAGILLIAIISYICFKLFNKLKYTKISMDKCKKNNQISQLLSSAYTDMDLDDKTDNTSEVDHVEEISDLKQDKDNSEMFDGEDTLNNLDKFDESDLSGTVLSSNKISGETQFNTFPEQDDNDLEGFDGEDALKYLDETNEDNFSNDKESDIGVKFDVMEEQKNNDLYIFNNDDNSIMYNDELDMQIKNDDIFSEPDEIADDNFTNNAILDEISETILENDLSEVSLYDMNISNDSLADIEPSQIQDTDFLQSDIIQENIQNTEDNNFSEPENYSSHSMPVVSGGSIFQPKTLDLTFTSTEQEVNTVEDVPEPDIAPAIDEDDSSSVPFNNFIFDTILGAIPTEEDILLDKIEADTVYVVDSNELENTHKSDESNEIINEPEEIYLADNADSDDSMPVETNEIINKPEEISLADNADSDDSMPVETNEITDDEKPDEENISDELIVQEDEIESIDEVKTPQIENNIEVTEDITQAETIEEETVDFKFELPEKYKEKYFKSQSFDVVPVDTFFADDAPDYDEKYFADTKEEDLSVFFKESDTPREEKQVEQVFVDDSEPIVIDQKEIQDGKILYLLRHNGNYSIVGTINNNVFVINKFETVPQKDNIIIKHNDTKENQDIYIVKVGNWRALVSVTSDNMENILTLS